MSENVGPQAPHELELVRAFVNTLDIEAGRDQLDTPDDLDGWLVQQRLQPVKATGQDLGRLAELREALRTALRAHHNHHASDEDALAVINDGMQWGAVRPHLSPDGLTWSSDLAGVSGLVGRLMAAVASAATQDTWRRLKACSNDTCQWAFYDHSRSRTGRWCSMQICGNRAKQQRFQRSAKSS